MNKTSDKYTRGTALMYNDRYVWVERQVSPSQVLVSYLQDRSEPSQMELVPFDDLIAVKNGRKPIKSRPPKQTSQDKAETQNMNEFYSKMGLIVPTYCMNCGKKLIANTGWARRCVSAHILPKSSFESIKMDPDNLVFMGAVVLGGCDCHDCWDGKGAEYRATMKIYPLALDRFHSTLKYKLNSEDYVKACTYLHINWK